MTRVPGIELHVGDITRLDVTAIANAANEALAPGGGVCGAIFRAAGPELAGECRALGGCPTGECRLTQGHGLKRAGSCIASARSGMAAGGERRRFSPPATAARSKSPPSGISKASPSPRSRPAYSAIRRQTPLASPSAPCTTISPRMTGRSASSSSHMTKGPRGPFERHLPQLCRVAERHQAARTRSTKPATSLRRRSACRVSSVAEPSTWVAAVPVSVAASVTLEMLSETSAVPCDAC